MKRMITPTLLLIAATTVATVAAYALNINPPMINVLGAYASIMVIFGLSAVVRIPFPYYCLALIFDFLATSVGSVLNIYRTVGFYDKFVHYMSGILLAALGILLIRYISKRCGFSAPEVIRLELIGILFAMFFSFAGAGLWEIYEFSMDCMTGGNMQGGNTNTMGDVMAGFGGGLTFGAFMFWWRRGARRKRKE